MVEGSGKPKDYAPLEQKWNFQEDPLKKAAEQFPYPTFPEGGTPQQIAAYMEQKKAIDAQHQAWAMQQLTTGGDQLMPNWMNTEVLPIKARIFWFKSSNVKYKILGFPL